MTGRVPLLVVAAVLTGLLGGCGRSDEPEAAKTATPTATPAPTSTNTVAGCQAAAIREILAGNLGDPDDGSGDYPECIGLSRSQLNVAAEGALSDPAVMKAMTELGSEIVDKGLEGIETDPPAAPTLPPDPLAEEATTIR